MELKHLIILLIVFIVIVMVLKRRSHYHEGKEVNRTHTENSYGQPGKSLYLSTNVLTLHQTTEITDEDDHVVYHAKSKFFTLHDRTTVTDAHGKLVSKFKKKFFTLHQRHYVTMANGNSFELSNEFFHLVKDITNISELGWKLEGNIVALNFTIKDKNENLIAFIGQKVLSLHDKYSIDIYDESKEAEIVTIVLVLQHMLRDRTHASQEASRANSVEQ